MKDPPPPIDLRIDASGTVYWNNSPTPVEALQQKMEEEVQRDPTNQPALNIDANPDAQYQVMAQVLAAARNAQMQKIGFMNQ
jgi:biopolymer transport protein ExbD